MIRQKLVFLIQCDEPGCARSAYVDHPLKRGETPPLDPELPAGWTIRREKVYQTLSGMRFETAEQRQICPECSGVREAA